mmetsp:Transcript_28160/g.58952  ORF Transcript_28160/g.58952 Transcript_28160/m.58952 type:complete len:222 (+) Transcript_28160:191-856(+)
MQIGAICQSTRSENVLQGKEGSSRQTKVSHPIKDGSEINIPSSKNIVGGNDDGLGSIESRHNIVRSHLETKLGSLFDGLVNPTIKFSKGGLQGHTHPDNKVLVGYSFERTDNIGICLIQVLSGIVLRIIESVAFIPFFVRSRTRPLVTVATGFSAASRLWAFFVFEAVWLTKEPINIRLPGNTFFAHNQIHSVSIHAFRQLENVIEEGISNHSARVECHIP